MNLVKRSRRLMDASVKGGDLSWRREMIAAAVIAVVLFLAIAAVSQLLSPQGTYWDISTTAADKSGLPQSHALYIAGVSAVYLFAAACILYGMRKYRPAQRAIWWILLVRYAWLAIFVPLRGIYVPDLFWWHVDSAVGTGCYLLAAGILVSNRSAAPKRELWVDALTICLGLTVVMYTYIGQPLSDLAGLSRLTVLSGVVIPVFDLVLIALTLLIAFTRDRANVALSMVIAAFVLMPIADITSQLDLVGRLHLRLSQVWFPPGRIAAVLIGVAALHPSMLTMQKRTDNDPVLWGRPRAMLIIVSFLLALGGLWLLPTPNFTVAPILASLSIVLMFLLICWRASRTMRALYDSRDRIRDLALRDADTGLPNLNGLKETYERAGHGEGEPGSLVLMRLSGLHQIGQLWGVALRDVWVRSVATRLKSDLEGEGNLARVSSDTFAVLIAPTLEAASTAADRVADILSRAMSAGENHVDAGGSEVSIVSTFDIGIACASHSATFDALLRDAESAVSIAHSQGENRVAHYDAVTASAEHRRLALLTSFTRALGQGEFFLRYQPVVDMVTRETVSFEALLRWQSPQFGEINPDEFIPLAESSRSIDALTNWVLSDVCSTISGIRAASSRVLPVSINISMQSLKQPGFAQRVLAAVHQHGLQVSDLHLELTEHAHGGDYHGELASLRRKGIRVFLDDFGTGYSNFAMLGQLGVDAIKIDAGFVKAIEQDAMIRDVCTGMLARIREYGISVIAEGIETEAQHKLLLSVGARYGQGWLYGRLQPSPG